MNDCVLCPGKRLIVLTASFGLDPVSPDRGLILLHHPRTATMVDARFLPFDVIISKGTQAVLPVSFIAEVEVIDPQAFKTRGSREAETVARYGGRYISCAVGLLGWLSNLGAARACRLWPLDDHRYHSIKTLRLPATITDRLPPHSVGIFAGHQC